MKLVFKQNKEQRMTADFKGNPIDAVETIIHVMNKSELVKEIIMTAAITYQELGGELDEEVKDFEVKEITKKS